MFKLLKKETILNSESYSYKHSSGARLIYLKNNDENKVFSVTFKTPPFDDTGVFHIIEHSVLCGSQKYPIKDPFNELSKGSLHTYLNAMTFQDKTMYPIASTNPKDFINLMKVYLDSVFSPLISQREGIFLQEGHRYEIENSNPKLNGIVYNEMKGAYSDLDRQIGDILYKELFKDSCYSYSSGGKHEAIPNLSYKEFLNTYKKYYTASNCYIYLYGDLDFNHTTAIISEYLDKFQPSEEIVIKKNQPFNEVLFKDLEYISLEDSSKNHLAYGFVLPTVDNVKLIEAFKVLGYILMNTEGSPLKQALKELGDDVTASFNYEIYQPLFRIIVKNSKVSKEEFKNTIDETLNKLFKDGISQSLIDAAISKYQFFYSEEDYGYRPKGLAYNITILESWLHGFEPLDKLKRLEILSELDKKYLESLIKDYILDNNYAVCLSLTSSKPEPEREPQVDIIEVEREVGELKKYQESEDSEAYKIPHIDLSDIKKEASLINKEEISDKVIFVETDTDVYYTNFLFETSSVPIEKLPYIGLISVLISKLDTNKYSYEELATNLNFYLGEINYGFTRYACPSNNFKPCFTIRTKILKSKFEKALEIVLNIITNTIFEDSKRIKLLLTELKSRLEKSFVSSGNTYAVGRSKANIHLPSAYSESVYGLESYFFLKNLLETYDSNWEEIKLNLKLVSKHIFQKENLIVATNKKEAKDSVLKFKSCLDTQIFKNVIFAKEMGIKKEAFVTASYAMYNAKVFNFHKMGFSYNGHMEVVSTILDGDYLMKEVRTLGGAYGVSSSFLRTGFCILDTYRDSNIDNTLKVFNQIDGYLDNLNLTREEIGRYIIGTINKYDRPKHNNKKLEVSMKRHFLEIDNNKLQLHREEILSTNLGQIRQYSEMFNRSVCEDNICVFGNEEKINLSSAKFTNIYKV